MGALLSPRLALDQREAISGLVLLAPAFFIDSKRHTLLNLIGLLGSVTDHIYLQKRGPSDIHDAAASSIHPRHSLLSLRAALSLNRLMKMVRPRLGEITQPALIIHSRQDHTCPYSKNLGFVMSHLGSQEKRAITLEESYHVITVDSEKDRIASEVTAFAMQFRQPSIRRATN